MNLRRPMSLLFATALLTLSGAGLIAADPAANKSVPAAAAPLPAPTELLLLLSGTGTEPRPPRTLTLPTEYTLGLDGDVVVEGNLFKQGYALLHTYGGSEGSNTALGLDALVSVTPGVPDLVSGLTNTAVGRSALRNTTAGFFNSGVGIATQYANTTGSYNTTLGSQALFSNTTGSSNTAVGRSALGENVIGSGNTAVGDRALFSGTGSFNAALGDGALQNHYSGSNNTAVGAFALFDADQGSNNIGVGFGAGSFLDNGSNNIYLGNVGESVESDTIRIGDPETHAATFLAGVRGTSVANGLTVLVGSLGRLGTMTSSRRFKEDIAEMGDASAALFALRPVTFRYREEAVDGDPRPIEFGLVAEEVAEVFPELVAYDDVGQPYAVRYHLLPAMLLNELQRQEREIRALRERLRAIEGSAMQTTAGPAPVVSGRRRR